ncbi:uncharacterized protein LOC135474710 [Liolophura sinensis]|uniref:uncharacterized protein LOC135474710 n=1 Tax=Liolophura sinensis TaxID=3198878 RepID=UPI003159560E
MLSSPLVLSIVLTAVILPQWRLPAEGSSWRSPSTNTAALGKTQWNVSKLFSHPANNKYRVLKKRQASDPVLQDLDALVAEEEAKTVDASSMAGEAGRGWSNWSPWSSCSVTCGTVGEKMRRRQCQNDPLTGVTCQGEDTDTKTCKPELLSCPETTSWGAWEDWGPCTFSCGDGVRTRERSCVVSDPGLHCPGDSAQTEPCNLQSCDLKESWTEWSEWSRCSVTCNAGHRSRERMCQDDATGVEAYQCPGKKHNTEVCDQPICSTGARVKTVHVMEGHSAMLKCLYDKMSPPVSIYWLTPDHLKITHQSQLPMYEAIGDTLSIRHTSTDMVGLYRCVVEDIHGKILMGEAPVDVLDCTTRPCRNEGRCEEVQTLDRFNVRFTTYRCICRFAFSGPTCERGIGPSTIIAIFLFLVLVVAVTLAIYIVWRLRQAERKPSKVIAPKESKLIVVTSRDALAVSCDESSSEAILSDSPLRQVDFDGDVNAPPNLKTSRGIGAIFPKFEWNNNNVLYQPLSKQLSKSQDSWANYGYMPANTSDLSKSESENNTASAQSSRHSDNANTNHKSEKSSYRNSGTSSGNTSSSTSTSTAHQRTLNRKHNTHQTQLHHLRRQPALVPAAKVLNPERRAVIVAPY